MGYELLTGQSMSGHKEAYELMPQSSLRCEQVGPYHVNVFL